MRLYKYGGIVSDNFLTINTADITLKEFVSGFDKSKIDSKVYVALNQIILKGVRDETQMSINMTDDRLVYCAVKIMMKYPDARYFYGLTEWYLVYRYLNQFYDKSIPNIDELIRFINLFIGRKFIENESLSAQELSEYKSLISIISNTERYSDILPKFVLDAISSQPTILLTEDEEDIVYNEEVRDVFTNLLNII